MSYLLLHWHEVVYLLPAIIFVVAYVVHFLPGMKDSKLKKILQVETILMLVLVFIAIIAGRVEKVAQKMDKRDDFYIEIVDDALRGKGWAKIREFESASELYGELIAAQERSTKEIRLARMRAMSADDLLTGNTTLLYKKIGEWLDAALGRVLYRVVNKEYLEIASELHKPLEGRNRFISIVTKKIINFSFGCPCRSESDGMK